uniref:Calponin-homology (CH) domain-containing protein n=1 Tax=Caenorhabditis japonica TaxID=281687 RepID=A0A8R1I4Q8_CAEJA
ISDESVSNRERLDNAFAAAEKEFGVSRLLDAEDVDTNNPDEKSIITYVSSLYNALPHLPELNRLQNVQDEYIEEAREWREWVERATQLVDDRLLSGTASELIYELQRFRDDDLPARDEQKRRLCLVYDHLEKSMRSTELFVIPRELSGLELQRAWNELLNAIERRFDVLERHRIQEVVYLKVHKISNFTSLTTCLCLHNNKKLHEIAWKCNWEKWFYQYHI